MSKKVISIIAIIALVAVLGVCLVACNADSYTKKLEKAGYTVSSYTGDDAKDESDSDADVKWVVSAEKSLTEYVSVICFNKTDDAKAYEEKASKYTGTILGVTVVCERQGKIVFYGTEQAVKDAK